MYNGFNSASIAAFRGIGGHHLPTLRAYSLNPYGTVQVFRVGYDNRIVMIWQLCTRFQAFIRNFHKRSQEEHQDNRLFVHLTSNLAIGITDIMYSNIH